MGQIWGRQDPSGPHVGPMNLAIWGVLGSLNGKNSYYLKQTLWVEDICVAEVIYPYFLSYALLIILEKKSSGQMKLYLLSEMLNWLAVITSFLDFLFIIFSTYFHIPQTCLYSTKDIKSWQTLAVFRHINYMMCPYLVMVFSVIC